MVDSLATCRTIFTKQRSPGEKDDLLFRRLWKVALHKVRRTWAAPVKREQTTLESTGQADDLGKEMLIYTHNFGFKNSLPYINKLGLKLKPK